MNNYLIEEIHVFKTAQKITDKFSEKFHKIYVEKRIVAITLCVGIDGKEKVQQIMMLVRKYQPRDLVAFTDLTIKSYPDLIEEIRSIFFYILRDKREIVSLNVKYSFVDFQQRLVIASLKVKL